MSSPIDLYVRRILSALVWLELASLHLTPPSLRSAYLAAGLTQSESALILPHQKRINAWAASDGCGEGLVPYSNRAFPSSTDCTTTTGGRCEPGVPQATPDGGFRLVRTHQVYRSITAH